MLSAACKDSIRAMIYVAKLYKEGWKDKFISIHKIAKDLGMSFYFLSKNFQKLVKAGLLESHRGPQGGIKLIKKPSEIKLIDIVAVIDGMDFFNRCILGFEECSDQNPCTIHHLWADKREEIYRMFSSTTLEDAIKNIEKFENVKV
ncbi:transcriptional regulator, BadM/Rrf2 family [Persephonella hydrogeniphila]|uniref:Transcriptional regulator, BadM/Rrf2 family n=1 Tax=Persephonella hydrogeniphila TaxID=198703 RepID=A0A285NMA9_9AQUI|nr:Rrf2 family transcriptional regulator [Persephonella hydrogeniphila]SNZ10368.1 transcriptional regulator, BadM/Rrf2 family [Persephonella hydrogeniphila]